MLTELTLRNFRCFERHTIPLRHQMVIVGRNNAGKSTIVEALRLVSHVVNRYGNFQLHGVPDWLDIPRMYRGVAPSLKGMDFSAETLYHRYGDPPARISARFLSGDRVELYVGGEPTDPKIFAVVFDRDSVVVTSRRPSERSRLPRVSILPQVAPLPTNERVLDDEYVRGAIPSSLAPIHFRNQIRLLGEFEPEFRRIAEETWSSLQIQGLQRDDAHRLVEPLQLMVRDGNFVAEVARMGHGLPMWLQTMWFLARTQNDPTVILDEPDVYMHADLQRRLIRFLRNRQQQVVVATHSIEIMAEMSPEDVLVVDRSRTRSRFAANLPAVQEVIDRMGGAHNIQLARLWNARRCLLVEGKDVGFLRAAHAKLFPEAPEPIDALPHVPLGGWTAFPYAIGSRMLLRNAGGEEIIPYCILDRDYHTASEIAERYEAASRAGVELHIWRKKEIENYFLIPSAIIRLLSSRMNPEDPSSTPHPSTDQVAAKIDSLVDSLKEETTDALAAEELNRDRSRGLQAANAAARSRIRDAWATQQRRWDITSGKAIWSGLSQWTQECFCHSLSAIGVARVAMSAEIPREMNDVISAIEHGHTFAEVQR